MNEEQGASLKEIRRIIRVLERMAELTKQASHTGALRDGQAYAIQQYNAIIEALAALGIEIPGYFPPITPEAGLGAVGFASAQLAEYLSEMVEGESKGAAEGGSGDEGTFFNQFFGSGEFQHIGEAMRAAIPDWVRETRQARANRDEARRTRERSRGAADGAREAPPAAASPDEGGAAAEWEGRVAEINARMVAAAEQMRQPEGSLEQRQRLAAELARLAEEQARLIRDMGARAAAGVHAEGDVEV